MAFLGPSILESALSAPLYLTAKLRNRHINADLLTLESKIHYREYGCTLLQKKGQVK